MTSSKLIRTVFCFLSCRIQKLIVFDTVSILMNLSEIQRQGLIYSCVYNREFLSSQKQRISSPNFVNNDCRSCNIFLLCLSRQKNIYVLKINK